MVTRFPVYQRAGIVAHFSQLCLGALLLGVGNSDLLGNVGGPASYQQPASKFVSQFTSRSVPKQTHPPVLSQGPGPMASHAGLPTNVFLPANLSQTRSQHPKRSPAQARDVQVNNYQAQTRNQQVPARNIQLQAKSVARARSPLAQASYTPARAPLSWTTEGASNSASQSNVETEASLLQARTFLEGGPGSALGRATPRPLPVASNDSYLASEGRAGLLAMTKFHQPQTAIPHFWNILTVATSLRWQTKAAFWLGVAYQALGYLNESLLCLYAAAENSTVFYGQLAQIVLQRLFFQSPQRVCHTNAFTEAIRGPHTPLVRLFAQGLPPMTLTPNAGKNERQADDLLQLYKELPDYGSKKALLASLSSADPFFRVRLYKRMFQEYRVPSFWGYPLLQEVISNDKVQTLYTTLADSPTQTDFFKTLSHAIILCESEFNYQAKSKAGAQGIMQLMPGTAHDTQQDLVRQHLLDASDRLDIHRATDNLILGAAHLKKLFATYGYNIVLLAAAYNAGSGSVEKWIKTYGDPRAGQISLLEWMESIPYKETRFYVQGVLEAFIVYTYLLRTEYLQDLIWPLF